MGAGRSGGFGRFIRAGLAVLAASPYLALIAIVSFLVLDLLAETVFSNLFLRSGLVQRSDFGRLDDVWNLGFGGTRDAAWERTRRAFSTTNANVVLGLRVLLVTWLFLGATAQGYFSTAVSRRAGDPLLHRLNSVHALRRAPRILASWLTVSTLTFGPLVLVAELVSDASLVLQVAVLLPLELGALFVLTRTSFVVPIIVADDDLTLGLGWAQALAASWRTVQGRTLVVFVKLVVLMAPAYGIALLLQPLAIEQAVTVVGLGRAAAAELTAVLVVLAAWAGAATALYVVDYRER